MRGLAVKARGRLFGGTPARLDLASLTAEGHGRRIALARPATLTYGDDGLDIQNFALAVDSGRLTSPAMRAQSSTSRRPRPRCRSPPPTSFRRVSASRASPTARRRSAGRWPIPPATGACGSTQVSAPQLRSARACRRSTSPARADSAAAARRLISRSTPGRRATVRVTGSAPLAADGALDLKIDGRLDAGPRQRPAFGRRQTRQRRADGRDATARHAREARGARDDHARGRKLPRR